MNHEDLGPPASLGHGFVDGRPSVQRDSHTVSARTVPSIRQAPSLARKFVRDHICVLHALPAQAASELVMSEIVSIAYFEAIGPIKVTFECHVTGVVVAVASRSRTVQPWFTQSQDELPRMIAESIASDWGDCTDETGDVLWHVIPTGYVGSQTAHGEPRIPSA